MTELLGVVMQHIPEIKALAAGFVDVAKFIAESVLVAIEYKDILLPLAGVIAGVVAVTKTWAIAQGAITLALSHPVLLGAAAVILIIAGAYKTLSRDAESAAQAVRDLNAAKEKTESSGGYKLPPGQTDYAPYSYTAPTIPTYSVPTYEGIAGGGSSAGASSPVVINNNINVTNANATASEIVSSLQRYQIQTGISRILLK